MCSKVLISWYLRMYSELGPQRNDDDVPNNYYYINLIVALS